jgi:DNA-binding response OmpR family regulator
VKTLVAWDDPAEAELLDLYLNCNGSRAHLVPTVTVLLSRARAEDWDCVLLSRTFPTCEQDSFGLFGEVQTALPDVPVVIGCRPNELMSLPRFLVHGARSHVVRDCQKDFIFLVHACLESAVDAASPRPRPSSSPSASARKWKVSASSRNPLSLAA